MMISFVNVRNHERFLEPKNVGDFMVQEKLIKYEIELGKIVSNKKYNIELIRKFEENNLKDDFDFWWHKVDRSYINNLIKLYKREAKTKK